MNTEGSCSTCVRLRLQCLGFGAKRPEWLRVMALFLSPLTPSHISQENRNVLDLRDKIKTFLASQGMIKGHSGAAPRAAEQEPQILALSADYASPTNSPQTPTLSISSTHDERPSSYPLRTDRYPDNDRKTPVCHSSFLPNPSQVYLSCTRAPTLLWSEVNTKKSSSLLSRILRLLLTIA
jgi:hypothetical protein